MKVHWENAKKVWYYEKWVERYSSFPPRQSVKSIFGLVSSDQSNKEKDTRLIYTEGCGRNWVD